MSQDAEKVKAILERLTEGKATAEDAHLLRRMLMRNQIALASGERSVAVGGDITHSTVVTGDGNAVQQKSKYVINIQSAQGIAIGDHAVDISISPLLRELTLPKPGSAPKLPDLFVGREPDMRELKRHLGVLPHGIVSNTEGSIVIVRGWPGVGKTTLASAIAYDEDVNKTFPDGVLWATLGPEPNLLSELAAWGRAIGFDELLRTRSVEEASSQLRQVMSSKRMLLIIDDVWDATDLAPFRVGGFGSAMLITTRTTDVAQVIAPTTDNIYKLQILNNEAAMEILRTYAPDVVDKNPQECFELVNELEGLPLALQISARMLNSRVNSDFGVKQLLSELRAGAKVLGSQTPQERISLTSEASVTVAQLLRKSTDRLDELTRNCFSYLGVFATKPATFDLEALKYVWQVEDPKPIVAILVTRGLLEPVGDTGRYEMHALIVAHAKSLLTED